MSQSPVPAPVALQALFLSILPQIQQHGQVYFRYLKCPHHKEDAIAEMVGLSWKWSIRLVQQGKNPAEFPTTLASFAAKAVRSGRRLWGHEKAKDVLSPSAQRRHGFFVAKLPDVSTLSENPLAEALHDNTRTPPDEQAAFRIDFPVWISSHSQRNQQRIEDLMTGEQTLEVATKHGLSAGRISQLRRAFHDDWQTFCGE